MSVLLVTCFVQHVQAGTDYDDYEVGNNNQKTDEEAYYYEEQDMVQMSNDYMRKVRLNHNLKLNCQPSWMELVKDEEFTFKQILFNQSVYELTEPVAKWEFVANLDYEVSASKHWLLVKNHHLFERLMNDFDGKKKPTSSHTYQIDAVKYSDSGHYYCVYTNTKQQYLIKAYLYIVFDGWFLFFYCYYFQYGHLYTTSII